MEPRETVDSPELPDAQEPQEPRETVVLVEDPVMTEPPDLTELRVNPELMDAQEALVSLERTVPQDATEREVLLV